MSDAFLVGHNLHKVYKNGRKEIKAVNGVNLQVRKGASFTIVGPSGAGKSTLLHLLGGLDNPTSGHVTMDGVDVYKLSDKDRADFRNKHIGFVFQFYHLLPEFTALENVMLPALIRGKGPAEKGKEIQERAFEMLKMVGLKDRVGHKPNELSGGESQRVAIARALINEPRALLCDEPTGNLDSKNSEMIYDLLFDLKSKRDMALVIVTHDEKTCSKTDETIRIKDGISVQDFNK